MNLKKLIVPIVILIGLVAYLYISKEESTKGNQPFSEFAFKDTASINKVILSNTLGMKITIHRDNESKQWKINDTDAPANKEKITRILSTLSSWKVIQDIDKNNMSDAIQQLSVKHSKVEVFTNGNDESFKTYYIGDANNTMTGNLGLLKIGNKKSNIPYYIQLPGFYGTLETRFFADIANWRGSEIIALNSRNIKTIDLQVTEFPEESYRLENKLDVFSLFDQDENPIEKFDTLAVRRHLVAFKTLHLESYVDYLSQIEIDSIIQSKALYSLKVTDKNNIKTKVDVYCKANESSRTAPDGTSIPCDPNRMLALINDKEFVVIQVFGWGNVFKPLSFFTQE